MKESLNNTPFMNLGRKRNSGWWLSFAILVLGTVILFSLLPAKNVNQPGHSSETSLDGKSANTTSFLII